MTPSESHTSPRSHYFITPDDRGERHEVSARIWDRDYRFVCAPGVFSAHRLDLGTSVLLNRINPPDPNLNASILDLGCGYGPIATALATTCPKAQIDAVDVNDLALGLTAHNARRHGVGGRVHPIRPDQWDGKTYDEIWSNPPIRIGKEQLHDLLATWLARLSPNGCAWLVVGKNLGSDSLAAWLNDQGFPTQKYASAKGFRILQSARDESRLD